jgi:hypothetical protein
MPVSLISPSARLRVVLRPSEIEYDPSTGPRRTKPPLAIRFDGGTATCPDDVWPMLEKHGAYTGVGQQKMVWRADEDERPEAGQSSLESVQVIGGMQVVTRKGGPREPLDGWDRTNVQELTKRIKSGEVTDLSNAIAYEASQRGRRMVMRALADAMGSQPEPKTAKKEKAEVPDTFSAEVSADA